MNAIVFKTSAASGPPHGTGWFARARGTLIGRAALASLLLHALAIAFVPGIRGTLSTIPPPFERLDVTLKPKAEIAPPAPREMPKPQQRERASPQAPAPRRILEAREPARRTPEARAEVPAPDSMPAPVPSIEPAPLPEAFKAPAEAEPARRAASSPTPTTDNLIAAYGDVFKTALDQQRRYPRVARERGWQGTATVLVKILPGGRLGEVSIAGSSGHALLDQTARDIVRDAQLPPLPEGLRGQGFEMNIPIEFRLV